MLKYLKIIFFNLCFIASFLLVSSPMYFDYDILYTIGEIRKSDFYLYVGTGGLAIILAMILFTSFIGIIFVVISRIHLKLHNKPPIGFFQKFWPYYLGIFFTTIIQYTNETKKSKIETFGPSYSAKNGVLIYKGMMKDCCKDFVKHYSLNKPNFDIFNQDEAMEIFSALFEGKKGNMKLLQNTLVTLIEKKKILEKLFEESSLFSENFHSEKFQTEVKEFMNNDKRAQALPCALVEDLVYEISVESPKKENKAIKEFSKFWFEYNFLVNEVATEFCELLIAEQGHYSLPSDNNAWKFWNEDAILKYNAIIDKFTKIDDLSEKLNKASEDIQVKINGLEKM